MDITTTKILNFLENNNQVVLDTIPPIVFFGTGISGTDNITVGGIQEIFLSKGKEITISIPGRKYPIFDNTHEFYEIVQDWFIEYKLKT